MSISQTVKKTLPNNTFVRSVSVLAGGAALGQIMVVAASPLLTRLYTPDDFGLAAVYVALLMIIGIIASLRYQLAIPLPKKDKDAASIVVLSLTVVLVTTTITSFVVTFWADSIATLLNTPDLAPHLWLLPIGLFLFGVYQVLYYWAIRIKAFPTIAKTKLIQALGLVTIQVGGYTFGPISLLLGQVAGQAAGSLNLALLAIRQRWDSFKELKSKDIYNSAKDYRRFPLYASWSGLFNTGSLQLPPLLIAAFFSPASAGFYMLAHQVLSRPAGVISSSISNVFFSHASDANRQGTLSSLVIKVFTSLTQIATLPMLILVILGDTLFALVFGTNWESAGSYAQILAPAVYFSFITSPISTVFTVTGRQREGMIFQIFLFLSRSSALLFGAIILNEIFWALILFSISGIISYILFLFLVSRYAKINFLTLTKPLMINIFMAAACVSPLLFAELSNATNLAWVTYAILTTLLAIFYYRAILRNHKVATLFNQDQSTAS